MGDRLPVHELVLVIWVALLGLGFVYCEWVIDYLCMGWPERQ